MATLTTADAMSAARAALATVPVPGQTLLATLAGSHAYRTAHADSDLDVRGVFCAPADALLGLRGTVDHVTVRDPDVVVHELGHFARLALKGTPQALEVLFCDDVLHRSTAGTVLTAGRRTLLSQAARTTYVGYGNSQVRKLVAGVRTGRLAGAHRAKHAAHTVRLLAQGHQLLATGRLDVACEPQLRARMATAGRQACGDDRDVDALVADLQRRLDQLATATSPLPVRPDLDAADRLVLAVRAAAQAADDHAAVAAVPAHRGR